MGGAFLQWMRNSVYKIAGIDQSKSVNETRNMCSNFGQLIYLQLRSICFCNAPFFTTWDPSIHWCLRGERNWWTWNLYTYSLKKGKYVCIMYMYYVCKYYVYSVFTPTYHHFISKTRFPYNWNVLWQVSNKVFFCDKMPQSRL